MKLIQHLLKVESYCWLAYNNYGYCHILELIVAN